MRQSWVEQVDQYHFSNSIYSFRVSSPFGNFHNISAILIIVICVMVISDQWFLMLILYLFWDAMNPHKTTNLTDKCACWLWVKYYQISLILHAKEKLFLKGRVNQCNKLYCHILRNCHRQPSLHQQPPWPVSSHQHPGRTFH